VIAAASVRRIVTIMPQSASPTAYGWLGSSEQADRARERILQLGNPSLKRCSNRQKEREMQRIMEAGRQLEPTTSRVDVVLHGATQFSLQIGAAGLTRLTESRLLDPIVRYSVLITKY
jgi:hypothetical protein